MNCKTPLDWNWSKQLMSPLASVAARKNPVHTVSSVIVPPLKPQNAAQHFKAVLALDCDTVQKGPFSKGAFPIDLVKGLVAQNAVALLHVVAI